ncbi:MAG: sodium:proton exchanger [Bacteroidia bacterium]|nr:sodium:proton exchanger [Bacteroidia bacterium]
MTNTDIILISLSALIIISYLFNFVAKYIKIPSVILLIATGIGLRFIAVKFLVQIPNVPVLLNIFGEMGLILIVLEAALDLDATRKKLPLISKSILASVFIIAGTCSLIVLLLHYYKAMPLTTSIIYSIPMGIISSSIAIPSVKWLSERKVEFIVYESTISDIIGIMVFNFVIVDEVLTMNSYLQFFINFIIIILISLASSALLIFMLNKISAQIKSFLIFAILTLIYTLAKIFHLPSLLLILVFGVMLNSSKYYIRGRLANVLHLEKMSAVTAELKLLTAESAFLIRTFFFILFGYTMNVYSLLNTDVIITGAVIVASILFVRFIFLSFISRKNVFPELFIAPRGLVTVVLFYSIPARYLTPLFDNGILYFIIIVSSLIMMLALIFTKAEYSESSRRVSLKEEAPVKT